MGRSCNMKAYIFQATGESKVSAIADNNKKERYALQSIMPMLFLRDNHIKMPLLNKIHHIAIICSDYEVSKRFYTAILGLTIIRETYREERNSYKLDLALNGIYTIELFSFPDPPERLSRPEARGLRHLAFEVDDLDAVIQHLNHHKVLAEPVRTDTLTGRRFTFIADPDGLPVEFYEKGIE